MNVFIKCAAVVVITLILYLVLLKEGRDFSCILSVASCCIIVLFAFGYMEPVIDFFLQLQDYSGIDTQMISIVMKSVGIGILTEVVSAFCNDAGNGALGKTLHIVASSVILVMSIPLFEALIALIEEILVTI